MADEPSDIILRDLREIRGEIGNVRKVQDQHSAKLIEISRRPEEMHESPYTSLGMAAHANVRHDSVQAQLDELRQRSDRLEEKA